MLRRLETHALHEFYTTAHSDSAALCGLALGVSMQDVKERAALWVRTYEQDRESGAPYALGLAELGLAPSSMILARPRDPVSALQAALEGARCPSLGAVILELQGEAKAYDLTASRRLALATKTSGVLILVARIGAKPMPSAAQTRWQIRSIPSQAMLAKAPGRPAFQLTLLRARNGLEGIQYQLEWDRDARQFISCPHHDITSPPLRHAPLPGAVVPIPADRSGIPQPWREAG